MTYNLQEANESGYLRRSHRYILPSKRRISYRYVIVAAVLFLIIGVELSIIMYGIMMKAGENLNEGRWELMIEGCKKKEQKEIEIIARNYLRGRNALFGVKELADHLRGEKNISELSIKKQYPNTIFIRARLKAPFAYLISGPSYLIDEEGNILGELYDLDGTMLKNYPIIYIEERENNEALVKTALRIIKEIGTYDHNYNYLKQVRYDGKDGVFFLELEEGLLKVSKDGAVEELEKYYAYRGDLAEFIKKDSLLDLRFDGQIVLK